MESNLFQNSVPWLSHELSKMLLFCMKSVISLVIFAVSLVSLVQCIEPITTGVAVGTATVLSALFANYDKLKSHFFETCDENWLQPNHTGLHYALKERLHGQHLVIESVVKAIKAHKRPETQPPKALVMSFHGWTGCGKNFVARMIAENLYKQGSQSSFVHLFVATHHFPHASRIETYKDQLREWIKGNVTLCPHSMFIFDEMDKMPPGLLDTIKPYIDHLPEINGVDYRNTIFIFLSNTGGNLITRQALEMWERGAERESIKYRDMEDIITQGAFNEQGGGLWHSSLIETSLINLFVPFLPMERKHVKMCVRDDLLAKGHPVTEETVSRVIEELQFFPPETKLYSKSGCKRVSEKVNFIMEDMEDLGL